MPSPQYSPARAGITETDSQGTTYRSNDQGGWEQISSGRSSAQDILSSFGSGGYQTQTPAPAPEQNYSVTDYFGGRDTDEYKDYQRGKSEGKWDDLPDFIAKQGGTEGRFVDNLMDSIKKDVERQTSYLEKYTKDNPFIFDEELAKQSSTEEYEPYYSELLEDYLGTVELRRETIEDDKKLQAELQKYTEGRESRSFAKAVTQAEEGFAGKGMFFSGNKATGIGGLEVEKVSSGEARQAQYTHERAGLDRRGTALSEEERIRIRDLEREQEEAIEGGVLDRRGEAITQYNVPLTQSYQRQFPVSGGQNALSGYLIPEHLTF